MTHEAGKGDTQRPTNHEKFSTNYDAIFRKKEKVLTQEAQVERDEFDALFERSGCTCFISPPCSYCMHPGNPRNQDEDNSAWTYE